MQQEINQTRELSSYEQLRVNNIKRNNARLRALGLISEAEEKQSNAAAEGITVLIVDESQSKYDQEYLDESPQKKRKRQDTLVEGSRKSLRLQGIGVDLTPIVVRNEEEIAKEREERVRECREARLKAAKAVAAAGAEKAAKENPTATYEHCLMRVKSMNDKRLANRVSQSIFCCG